MKRKEELVEASRDLYYEMWLLRAMHDLLSVQMAISANRPDLPQAAQNALVESFAIHARNLIAFFYPRSRYRDCVTSAHFFPEPDRWKQPAETALLKQAYKKANQQAAHPTWSRAKYVGKLKKWDHQNITDDIEAVWRAFLCAVPPENLDPVPFGPELAAIASTSRAGQSPR